MFTDVALRKTAIDGVDMNISGPYLWNAFSEIKIILYEVSRK